MKNYLMKTKRTHNGSRVYRLVLLDMGKYTPHQGKRECARRVEQMAKARAS